MAIKIKAVSCVIKEAAEGELCNSWLIQKQIRDIKDGISSGLYSILLR